MADLAGCSCPGCEAGLVPFTVDHFVAWSSELTLDSGVPWRVEGFQLEIAADIFAGFREVWALIPEGNGKTTSLGAVALYHCEHRSTPWVPIGAASRDQAKIMFTQAAGFVERSDRLSGVFRVYGGYRRIASLTMGGEGIQVYAADVKTGDGVIPTLALVDELHRHDDLRLYRLWKGKLGKRGGQIATISTAGEPGSEFEEMRETIRNQAVRRDYLTAAHVRAEGKNLAYHEWMVQDRQKARDLEIVKAANPLEQITVGYLREKLESETLDFGEDWLRLTCNIATRSSYAAIPEGDWDACETDERIPVGTPVAVGFDVAWLMDTTAIVPLWVKEPTVRMFGSPTILTPPRDGTMLNPDEIRDAFLRIHEHTPIEMVVMDMHRAEEVAHWLSDSLGITVVDRPQTNAFAIEDYDRFIEAIGKRWIRHDGDRNLRRHVLNAVARRLPGEKYRFDRPSTSRNMKKQDRRVIDALTAAAMVHSASISKPEPAPARRWRPL